MWALIAFIVMTAVILTLTEINERIKARKSQKSKDKRQKTEEDCKKEAGDQACSACELMSVCEKKPTPAP